MKNSTIAAGWPVLCTNGRRALRRASRAMLLAVLVFGRPAVGATLVNGDFGDGFAGWESSGAILDVDGVAVFTDEGGIDGALFQTFGSTGSEGHTLSFDFLNGLSDAVPFGSFPDGFFATLYFGNEPFGTDVDAGNFLEAVNLLGLSGRSDPDSGGTIVPSSRGEGWFHFSITYSTPLPFVTLAFEFVAQNSVPDDSLVALDGIALVLEADADLDGDGLTNGEEAALGTDPYLADTDADGQGDGAEVTAMTDPLDPRSSFRLVSIAGNSEERSITLEWTSVPGVQYAIESSTDAVSWGPASLPHVALSGRSTTVMTLADPEGPTRLFRIRVLP